MIQALKLLSVSIFLLLFFVPVGNAQDSEIEIIKTCPGSSHNITVLKTNNRYHLISTPSSIRLTKDSLILWIILPSRGQMDMRYYDNGKTEWTIVYVYDNADMFFSGELGAISQCKRLAFKTRL